MDMVSGVLLPCMVEFYYLALVHILDMQPQTLWVDAYSRLVMTSSQHLTALFFTFIDSCIFPAHLAQSSLSFFLFCFWYLGITFSNFFLPNNFFFLLSSRIVIICVFDSGSIAATSYSNHKANWRVIGLFDLHSILLFNIAGNQDRNWNRAGYGGRSECRCLGGVMFIGLLPLACSPYFLLELRTTSQVLPHTQWTGPSHIDH